MDTPLPRCWICEREHEGEHCPDCGEPGSAEPEPTPAELLLEAQSLYGEEDFEGDDAYAQEVCVPRWGPL